MIFFPLFSSLFLLHRLGWYNFSPLRFREPRSHLNWFFITHIESNGPFVSVIGCVCCTLDKWLYMPRWWWWWRKVKKDSTMKKKKTDVEWSLIIIMRAKGEDEEGWRRWRVFCCLCVCLCYSKTRKEGERMFFSVFEALFRLRLPPPLFCGIRLCYFFSRALKIGIEERWLKRMMMKRGMMMEEDADWRRERILIDLVPLSFSCCCIVCVSVCPWCCMCASLFLLCFIEPVAAMTLTQLSHWMPPPLASFSLTLFHSNQMGWKEGRERERGYLSPRQRILCPGKFFAPHLLTHIHPSFASLRFHNNASWERKRRK